MNLGSRANSQPWLRITYKIHPDEVFRDEERTRGTRRKKETRKKEGKEKEEENITRKKQGPQENQTRKKRGAKCTYLIPGSSYLGKREQCHPTNFIARSSLINHPVTSNMSVVYGKSHGHVQDDGEGCILLGPHIPPGSWMSKA